MTLVDRLRDSGVRLSAQRRIIAECLDGTDQHLTADELLARSQEQLSEIGRATVYKALTAFVDAGQVRMVRFDDGATLYDPNAHLGHDHLVCRRCGGVWDVTTEPSPTPLSGGFTVDSSETTYRGVCADCAESASHRLPR